mmetsp:Transcript_26211/g.53715  ORF Transcript_26211/g.53715 Transcript_26211/m.53715 type:complete len:91 (+) Transcript_26211:102-374(+)|eukprot:CAMPEP_0183307660 /NCGR_PEP_ID=MMETSP0160_2-20130417/18622_1 /TAXON_ID=2839 ORGANISM="Odontella Sinensis, Strain Grunow 1884" /NCGR_SAMPLE_ID=MMETSP0160_2 /ASSEMBLY_ACC=CAM_ASM_000250 /LENGTH=90 /DNA_ID=CAMNT_0025471295 /DNA_START=84 /DNA_END=356 /DNA_ORIENTATION=+
MARGRAIKLTMEHLKIAARKPRFSDPPCHEETMKILNGMQAANFDSAPLYKYVKEYDACRERLKEERKRGKPSTLYYLSKYVNQNKNRIK